MATTVIMSQYREFCYTTVLKSCDKSLSEITQNHAPPSPTWSSHTFAQAVLEIDTGAHGVRHSYAVYFTVVSVAGLVSIWLGANCQISWFRWLDERRFAARKRVLVLQLVIQVQSRRVSPDCICIIERSSRVVKVRFVEVFAVIGSRAECAVEKTTYDIVRDQNWKTILLVFRNDVPRMGSGCFIPYFNRQRFFRI